MTDREFLLAVKEYIEQTEVANDTECGLVRKLDELIADGEMPALYTEVNYRLNEQS